jgi:chromosome segregation ATPase
VQLNQKETEVASLTASNEALTAQVAELTAKLEAATAEPEKVKQDLADAQSQLSASQADASAAVASLKEVAKSVLTAAGKPDAVIPETVTELTQVISDTKSGLAAVLVVGGRSQDSVSDVAKTVPLNLGAYRTGRK